MVGNTLGIIDDARCYEVIRSLRWPDGVSCPTATRPTWSSWGGMRPSRNASGTRSERNH
jgi:hypothetical protein